MALIVVGGNGASTPASPLPPRAQQWRVAQRVKSDATLAKRSTHCNSTEGSLRLSGEILPKTNYCGGGKGERCYDSKLLSPLSSTLLFQM